MHSLEWRDKARRHALRLMGRVLGGWRHGRLAAGFRDWDHVVLALQAREANEQASLLCRLPLDVQASILYHLTTAHDIARTARTCRTLCDAAKLALKARPFSSEVVTLAGHTQPVVGVAAATDGEARSSETQAARQSCCSVRSMLVGVFMCLVVAASAHISFMGSAYMDALHQSLAAALPAPSLPLLLPAPSLLLPPSIVFLPLKT